MSVKPSKLRSSLHRGGFWSRCILLLACVLSARLSVGAAAVEDDSLADVGPLFDVFPLTLAEGTRTEVLGPLFYSQTSGDATSWGVPPLFSRFEDPSVEHTEMDFLYPVMTYDRFGTEYRWQFLQWLSFSGGDTQAGASRRRFTLFPFYWQQRSTQPEENYTAIWPIHGTMKQRLLRDEVNFTLWPLYVRTVKARGNVETRNYLAPIFHRRTGDGLTGWQAWPFVGSETKLVTQRTNIWNDVELVPGHEQQFILWPLWLSESRGIGTTNQAELRAMLPLFIALRSPQRDSSTYLWPIGLTLTENRAQRYHETQFLWPVFAFARGEGKTSNRVWPLYGRTHTPRQERDFILWPLYLHTASHSPTLERERDRILFFLYSDFREQRLPTQQSRRRVDLWPMFTRSRELNGNTRLQIFAPLEPLIPDNKGVQRNWSPLWSVWRSEYSATNDARSQSLLWNLYRRDRNPAGAKTSLLFGLFQHTRTEHGSGLRLFYVPVKRPATTLIAPASALPQLPGAVTNPPN
jgi:hypothetical protein